MPRKKVGITIINEFKSTGKKVFEHKPFEIGSFKFFPCNFTHHKKAGFYYFLLCRDSIGHPKCERLSPVFKDRKEAEDFVYNRTNFSIRPV